MIKLMIIGAGSAAREVRDIVCARALHEIISFVADPEFALQSIDGVVVHDFNWLGENADTALVICGIGSPELRRHLAERALKTGVRYAPAIFHPSVSVGHNIVSSEGSVVAAGTSIMSDVTIGRHAYISLHATIGHNAIINDYATIMPGVHVSGNVIIGEGALVGIGACVLENIRVGAWGRVGAGCVVKEDVPPNTTVVGVPGRVVRHRAQGWHL